MVKFIRKFITLNKLGTWKLQIQSFYNIFTNNTDLLPSTLWFYTGFDVERQNLLRISQKKLYFYTHLFVDYRKIIQYYQYSQSILPWSKLIKFQKYGLPFTLIIIITLNLIINRYSSKINSLYVTPKQTIEKVPIKKQLIIIVANKIITNTRTHIYGSFNLAFIQRATTKRERADGYEIEE